MQALFLVESSNPMFRRMGGGGKVGRPKAFTARFQLGEYREFTRMTEIPESDMRDDGFRVIREFVESCRRTR